MAYIPRPSGGGGGGGGDALKSGTLAQFAATTSLQLKGVISDETGSGALVFATSPALVTPALGTPSSGTLTNCTFPTLNQSTTGSAATLTTARAINGVSFDGSAAITITAAAGTLTGSILASGVTASSLTGVGTLTSGATGAGFTVALSTSTITGTLGAARGGFGADVSASSGVPLFATGVVTFTGSTGSGNFVRATSPTLVTPALGTPSSGNLANCTFPTLNQNTTGNAATATLAGGAVTAGSATTAGSAAQLTTARTINGVSFDGTANIAVPIPFVIQVSCSDLTSALTSGVSKAVFRMPAAMTVTEVRASVKDPPTGSTIIIDINEQGTSILSTKLSIDSGESTSTTAASAAVISDAALADDAEITIDFDQVGSGTTGAGVMVTLIGTY